MASQGGRRVVGRALTVAILAGLAAWAGPGAAPVSAQTSAQAGAQTAARTGAQTGPLGAAPGLGRTGEAGRGTSQLVPANPTDLVFGDQPYRLRPGDVIQVSVLEDGSLDRQLLVQPDGRIALPLAGAIDADGLTPDEVERAIRGRLAADVIEPPTVTVSLVSLAPGVLEEETFPTIYVTGQVNAPGRYQIQGPVTALQALAIAGGPGVFAATERIQVRRVNDEGAETVFIFDYDAVEEGRPSGGLLELDDGDVLVVPERGLFE